MCSVQDKGQQGRENSSPPAIPTSRVSQPPALPNAVSDSRDQSVDPPPPARVKPPTTAKANYRPLPARGKSPPPIPGAKKRKHKPMSRPPRYFEDAPSESDEDVDALDGDGSSSGESVSPDAVARIKRVRVSTITTRSSARIPASDIMIQDAIQPSSHSPVPYTGVPAGDTVPSPVDAGEIVSDSSTELQPPDTPTDTMDVDDSDDTHTSNEAPGISPIETEIVPPPITEAATCATVAEATAGDTVTEAAHDTGTELIGTPTTAADVTSITPTVTPLPASSNVIDVGMVPAFLRSHGKGTRKVDIFEYLNKVQDPRFRQVLFQYINFETNDKSGASGSLPTKKRPVEIGQWSSRARPASLPEFTEGGRALSAFADSVLTWWGSIQPPWRSFEHGTVSRKIQGDWGALHAPRVNGMLNIVVLAYWWVQALEQQNTKGTVRTDYEFFADDVAWVLFHLSN